MIERNFRFGKQIPSSVPLDSDHRETFRNPRSSEVDTDQSHLTNSNGDAEIRGRRRDAPPLPSDVRYVWSQVVPASGLERQLARFLLVLHLREPPTRELSHPEPALRACTYTCGSGRTAGKPHYLTDQAVRFCRRIYHHRRNMPRTRTYVYTLALNPSGSKSA